LKECGDFSSRHPEKKLGEMVGISFSDYPSHHVQLGFETSSIHYRLGVMRVFDMEIAGSGVALLCRDLSEVKTLLAIQQSLRFVNS